MTTAITHELFSSVLRRLFQSRDGTDHRSVSHELGYRGTAFLEMWLDGKVLPPLGRLAELANAIDVPLEDLLLPWLAERDPEHAQRYRIIAAQLLGLRQADDLLSGARENSATPWWGGIAPMSAAELVSEMENPPLGVYRDWIAKDLGDGGVEVVVKDALEDGDHAT